jgi:hypothetical protein
MDTGGDLAPGQRDKERTMDRLLRAALAASVILGGSTLLAPAARADDTASGEKTATSPSVEIGQLERHLAQLAREDAEAMAADAMIAASDLDLDIGPAGPMTVVLASDL